MTNCPVCHELIKITRSTRRKYCNNVDCPLIDLGNVCLKDHLLYINRTKLEDKAKVYMSNKLEHLQNIHDYDAWFEAVTWSINFDKEFKLPDLRDFVEKDKHV